MIKITIFKKDDLIAGFQVKGHSGYAQEGQDIVCSGVSVATQMALLGLKEILKFDFESNIDDGFLVVRLDKKDYQNASAQVLLQSMEKTLEDIAKNYSKFVKMEVRRDVY